MTNNRSPAFTLIELLVVIAIIAILIGIATPVFTGVLDRAKATKDMSNLRQIGLIIQTYLNDNDQILPAAMTWPGTTGTPVLYPKYIATRKIFQSPFDKRASLETDLAPVSYSINANMYVAGSATPPGIDRNMARVVSPASTILMAPNYNGNPGLSTSWTGTATNVPNLAPGGGAGMTIGPQRGGAQINALFCDLHAETMTFGPNGSPVAGSFKDTTTDPLGLKHWDPTK
jgi:prepilin-type N-terminal cleavage/methylation domain-containing protein